LSFNSTDLVFYFSSGGGPLELRANNKGGSISATAITSSTMRNFCPDIPRSILGNMGETGTWNIYFPFFIKNTNATSTITNLYIWTYKPSSHPSITVAVGKDPAGVGAAAQVIANQTTKPTGVTFLSSVTESTSASLFISALTPGQYHPCWVNVKGQKGIPSIPMVTFGIKTKFVVI
jgi:hypothetical protein